MLDIAKYGILVLLATGAFSTYKLQKYANEIKFNKEDSLEITKYKDSRFAYYENKSYQINMFVVTLSILTLMVQNSP